MRWEKKDIPLYVYHVISEALHEHDYANQLAGFAMRLAPTRQGILAYKCCYLYPSKALMLPAPFTRQNFLNKTWISGDEYSKRITCSCIA